MAINPTTWKSVSLPQLPVELTVSIKAITDLADVVLVVLGLLDKILTPLIGLELDPTKLALKIATEAIQAGLDALQGDGVYVLFVPVQRQVVIPPIVQEAMAQVGISALPAAPLSFDMLGLQGRLNALDTTVIPFFNAPGPGGNAAYFRTVVNSILDTGDPNRPLLKDTDYVAGLHLIAGASSFTDLLSLTTRIDALLGVNLPIGGMAITGLPTPQDLKAIPLLSTTGLPSVQISWNAQPAFTAIAALRLGVATKTVVVVRSTDTALFTATTPLALFGTDDLTPGMTAPNSPETVVVSVQDYKANAVPPDAYLDSGLTAGVTYYYTTSFKNAMGPSINGAPSTAPTDQGYHKFSGVVAVTAKSSAGRTARSTPPDWIRTPSVLGLLPDVSAMIGLLGKALAGFSAGLSGASATLGAYVTFLRKEIAALGALITRIKGLVNGFASLSVKPLNVGLFARAFIGLGGTDFMLADLGASLAPTNPDPNRPAFDRGDEFVTGVVILAGGPSKAAVEAVQALLSLLFGLTGGSASSPLSTALQTIDAVLATQEQVHLDAAFATTSTALTATTPSSNPPLTDENDPGSCAADETPPPVFGDDFGVT